VLRALARFRIRLVVPLAVGILGGCGSPPESPRPNFVVLLADDLGYGDLGSYGAPDVRTPNLDRLAGEGALFTDAYAASPLCSPTRAALMMGSYPQRLGHAFEDFLGPGSTGLDPALHTALPELLRRAGYRTACYGKWNLQGHREPGRSRFIPNAHGCEHWVGTRRNHDYFTHRSPLSKEADLFEDGRPIAREGHTDRILADHAVRFIERASAGGEPFFLYVPWLLPHQPIQDPETGELRPANDRRTYARMVEFLDLQVGRVLEALRTAGVDERTLVAFTSDNGGHPAGRNLPFRGGKGSLAEGGIRVPLLLRWTGRVAPARRIGEPVITMDLAATILAAAGLADAARATDGVDLLPAATGSGPLRPRTLFWRQRRVEEDEGTDVVRERAVRDGAWKLRIGADGLAHLHRLDTDPGERDDLAAQQPERVDALRRALEAWEREMDGAKSSAAAPARAPRG
jgi:arylsulfatase A-like enzyme